MTPLPTAGGGVSCEGCDACCMHVAGPLGYGLCFPTGPLPTPEEAWASEEAKRVLATPAGLRQGLADDYAGRRRGEVPDRDRLEMPCLWLDPRTRRCAHYEWRPQV